ncbi:major facilitator superfamily MFS_1 (plasmid) [Peptoclostridium acidaminophilum DSM 3953]|uniref:Major facilitator superfamily MFS_1 n=1 Tax=Peptoclostridium acidaminophilum DSM 3953 TaxID=1286171 RepID=W8TNP7_PEPAC|nr:MFS transporter [Peptoclostridium acidaminophilum]AHM57787.1 major facilitator superfamily MFS_1 [Peptoclostridium acidaminophilum DSM 3953]
MEIKQEDIRKVESYRWVVWTILALMYIFVTFHRMATGVVKSDLEETFKIGAAQFANIGSMYFYAYFLMQIPSGILADKIGPKKTVTWFSILAAVGSVVFGLAPNLTVAYIGRFLVGIGVSVVFICLIKIQSRWFYSKNFALMIGFVGLAANAGALLAQTPLVYAASAFGWRSTFVYLGAAMVFFAVLTMIFVKDDPTDIGLPGMDELEGRPAVKVDLKVGEALKSVLSNPRTWTVSVVNIGMYVGYIVLLGQFGVPYLMTGYGLEKVQAANLIISAVIGSAVGAMAIGYVSDKIMKRKIVLVLLSAITLAAWIVFIYFKLPVGMLPAFLFMHGFVMTNFTMTWTIANEVNDRRLAGIATGVVNCVGFAGAATIPVYMGKILDANLANPLIGYQKAYFVLIVVVAISLVASFFATETNAKNVYESK